MKPEKHRLIDDLLGDPARREATLVAGGQILRRRRHRRAAVRGGFAFLMLLMLAGLWLETAPRHNRPTVPMAAPLAASPSPIQPQALTDDELLALFPNTPVGLATLPDGRKRLIFPRPGDEQKFITSL